MKKLYFLLFLVFSLITNAQIVNIPDANFKAKLLSATSSNSVASISTPSSNGSVSTYNVIDTNGDGEIQVTEAEAIKYLSISFSTISDLTGIEAFVNLQSLYCSNNQLTSLDITQNINLTHFECMLNQLTSLDVTQNFNLSFLNCSLNQITDLDISQAPSLKNLRCENNDLTSLDVTHNLILIELKCSNNQLSNINITQNPNLESLSCSSNLLTSLDVTQNLNLQSLSCGDNQLSTLDVTQNPNLQSLGCGVNQLSTLDVTQNSALTSLSCDSNLLTSLDVTQNLSLRHLNCDSNLLTSLDVIQNVSLDTLYCGDNQLTNLDVTQNINLFDLKCALNFLTNLDVSQNIDLHIFYCWSNQLTNIDVTHNTELIWFGCSNNQLTNLDLSQNINLTRLYCGTNQLSSIDLSNNINLFELSCHNNQLLNLDVIANSALNLLDCKSMPTLEAIFMKNNNATAWSTLDFSGNPNLEFVCCDDDDLAVVQQKIIDYGYTACQATNLNCTYPVVNEVSGIIRYDYWDFPNGCDPSDYRVPNVKLEVNNGTSTVITTANQVGSYYIPLGNGNYTITPVIENPDYFNVSPTNFSVDFPTDTSPFTQDICLTWNGLAYYDDLEVVILPTTPARPGFEAKYKVIVRNKGFDYTNGTLVFTYDDAILTYASSSPVFSSSTTNTLTRNFFSDSFSVLEFDITFNLNSPSDSPAVNIDDELHFTADVTHDWTDYYPADNTFTLDQTVVGSYDPNDKTCLQGETEEVEIVGEYVHYLIRFENTGTYAAEKVVIEDIIDTSKFDVSTLIPIDASHSYYTKITGNVVEFVFDNINLDFNDPDNDGFITYKIKLLPTLTVGDTFSNSANIYFDSNPAIVTNTYTTTIVNTLSSQIFGNEEFVLYPNPATAILNISTKNQTEIQSVEIYNILGQVVIAIPNVTNSIDVSSLEAGTYFIKLNTEKGSTTTKFVKE